MLQCKICEDTVIASMLGTHLRKHHKILSKDYFDKYIACESDGKCATCGKPTKFWSINSGYAKTCSRVCAQLNPETRRKIEATCSEKYGGKAPAHSCEVQRKAKATLMDRYGVDVPYHSTVIKEKGMRAVQEKYGVTNVFQHESIKEISRNTMMDKYGVELNILRPDVKEHIKRSKRAGLFNSFLNRLSAKNISYLDDYERYVNYDGERNYKCNECDKLFTESSTMAYDVQCGCLRRHSKAELEIRDWLVSLGYNVTTGDFIHDAKGRLEIDVMVTTNVKIGIEFCGLYWHSELHRPNDYHRRKLKAANDNGIDLIQIFEDEWNTKKDIVQSIILNKLGHNSQTLYARKCSIRKLDKAPIDFVNDNHIQGHVPAKYCYGLFYDNELVSVATFGKNRFQRDGYECLRFCTKLGVNVVGGFGRLLKMFISDLSPTLVKSYCDLRYFTGSIYEANGFVKESDGVVGYEYCPKGFKERLNRVKFQKHKLKNMPNYSEDLTEVEIMNSNGYYRIFDAGQSVYVLNLM